MGQISAFPWPQPHFIPEGASATSSPSLYVLGATGTLEHASYATLPIVADVFVCCHYLQWTDEETGVQRLSNWWEVTQLVSSRAGICTKAV